MNVMFTLVPILIGIVFVITMAGAVVNLVLFGTVFGMVTKRLADHARQEQLAAAAHEPTPCRYCGEMIPFATPECPGCGARRQV